MPSARKNITITEKQAEWIKRVDLNLSRFVQRKLDEEIKRRGARFR